jgi:hypothetical protein
MAKIVEHLGIYYQVVEALPEHVNKHGICCCACAFFKLRGVCALIPNKDCHKWYYYQEADPFYTDLCRVEGVI